MNEFAELIRRNPAYVKEARKFKEKWDDHFKVFPCPNGWLPGDSLPLDERQNLWIFNSTKKQFQKDICIVKNLPVLDWPKAHPNPVHKACSEAKWILCGYSEKLKNFLESWELTRFLDPDSLKDETSTRDTFRVTEVSWTDGEKTEGDKYLYIRIRRGSKPSIVKKILDHMAGQYRKGYEKKGGRESRRNDPLLKKQLEIYDLRVLNRQLSFALIAKKILGGIAHADAAKKAFYAIEKRIKKVKSELP